MDVARKVAEAHGIGVARCGVAQVEDMPRQSMRSVEHVVRARREKLRLSRFFAPSVLRQIVDQRAEPGRSRRLITVLFSDIRGFTRLSAGMETDDVVDLLNDYFPALVEAIMSRIGELHRRGVTFLVIEHNLDVVMRLCRPVLVMVNGGLLLEGEPEAVRADPRVVDAYLGGAPE